MVVFVLQADVEISFDVSDFKKAEKLDPGWTNPQLLCSQKGASVKGALGPFGLLALASKDLKEYTAVFFRIFKGEDNKFVVLMCSDQSRSLQFFSFNISSISQQSDTMFSNSFSCFIMTGLP